MNVCVCVSLLEVNSQINDFVSDRTTDQHMCTDSASGHQTGLILGGGVSELTPCWSVRSLTLIQEGHDSLKQDFNQHLFI